MSKELEALTEIKRQVGNIHYFDFTQNPPKMTLTLLINTPFFGIIESALKRLEQIEINQTIFGNNPITVGKKIMALGIIKKKRVFIGELLQSDSLEEYNDYVEEQGRYDEDKLTQEEYDLLKEVLS